MDCRIVCLFVAGSLTLSLVVGRDFFPYVDAAQIKLHVRTPEGTRIEQTERIFGDIEKEIRAVIPAHDLDTLLDNIGLPNSGINLAFGDSANIASSDGDILVSLNPDKHIGTQDYERALRERLRNSFPDETFFFQPANITNQILNFGLSMPIDVQIMGRDAAANYALALDLRKRIAALPDAVDVFIRQEVQTPTIQVNVDRVMANQAGMQAPIAKPTASPSPM